MAADLSVYFDFGGSDGNAGTNQDTDGLGPPSIRFKVADNATIDLLDPIPIPPSGTNYSYFKHIYLKCDTAPDTQVDNIRFFTDGTGFGTGITLNVGDQFPTNNSGAPESGYEVCDAATELTVQHSGISSVSDAFTFNTGSPMTGPSISEASSIIAAIGHMTDYLLLQMVVTDAASPGNLSNETLTFRYDEI